MDFASTVLFLFTYYVRPQEWSGFLANLQPVKITMVLGLAALIFRPQTLRLNDLFRTPHDWAMLAFWLYLPLTSQTPWATFTATFSYYAFYILAVQGLTSLDRIRRFMGWWTVFILVIAGLALASEIGFDPLGSYDLTHGVMKDRLTLHLSIFRNPNALGHNVVPALAMVYYFYIYRRPLVSRISGWALIVVPAWCIWLTVSKGAFIAAGCTIVATATFGRPRWAQITMLSVFLLFGGTVFWQLPRMTELKTSQSDEAIGGRVDAFTFGLESYQGLTTGLGFGTFLPNMWKATGMWKASHSSYVQIGSELGAPGFFLFWAVVYCNLRTLLTAQNMNPEEERVRRLLFIILFSYLVSSWMVDLGYRPTFFLFSGAIAAFHRYLVGTQKDRIEEMASDTGNGLKLPSWRVHLPQIPGWQPQPVALAASPELSVPPAPTPILLTTSPVAAELPISPKIWHGWNRLGIVDAIFIFILLQVMVRFWAEILKRM